MNVREALLRVLRTLGALIGYGCLALFLALITFQVYRWMHDGEWTHVGLSEALHLALLRCGVNPGDTGHLASLVQWLDTPVHWLGLHRVLEVLPASLGLFALSILGNALFIYCRDSLEDRRSAQPEPLRTSLNATNTPSVR